jgi:putative ABC transport system ATP-binding protein
MIMSIFEELNAGGRTVIIITHEEGIARRCKRMISMSDGRIISDVLTHKQYLYNEI